MSLEFPQGRVKRAVFPDIAGLSAVGYRDSVRKWPVRALAEGFVPLSGLIVSEGKEVECGALSRCSVTLFDLAMGSRTAEPPAVPPPLDAELWGLMGGRWVRIVGFQWAPLDYVSAGPFWWQGGLVEGFGLFGRILAGVGAVELQTSIRWEADRAGAVSPFLAVGGPKVTVVP